MAKRHRGTTNVDHRARVSRFRAQYKKQQVAKASQNRLAASLKRLLAVDSFASTICIFNQRCSAVPKQHQHLVASCASLRERIRQIAAMLCNCGYELVVCEKYTPSYKRVKDGIVVVSNLRDFTKLAASGIATALEQVIRPMVGT